MGLDPDAVKAYLKRNLEWVYVKTSGEVLDAAKFPNNKITVMKGKGSVDEENKKRGTLQEYLDYSPMYGATENKIGCASANQVDGDASCDSFAYPCSSKRPYRSCYSCCTIFGIRLVCHLLLRRKGPRPRIVENEVGDRSTPFNLSALI